MNLVKFKLKGFQLCLSYVGGGKGSRLLKTEERGVKRRCKDF